MCDIVVYTLMLTIEMDCDMYYVILLDIPDLLTKYLFLQQPDCIWYFWMKHVFYEAMVYGKNIYFGKNMNFGENMVL